MKYNTKILAYNYGITHTGILKIIKQYKEDFEKFGTIEIEKKLPKKNSNGGRPSLIFKLNEKQKMLLLIFLGNKNWQVRYEKRKLVKKYFECFKETL